MPSVVKSQSCLPTSPAESTQQSNHNKFVISVLIIYIGGKKQTPAATLQFEVIRASNQPPRCQSDGATRAEESGSPCALLTTRQPTTKRIPHTSQPTAPLFPLRGYTTLAWGCSAADFEGGPTPASTHVRSRRRHHCHRQQRRRTRCSQSSGRTKNWLFRLKHKADMSAPFPNTGQAGTMASAGRLRN